jgi:hypothetical protein
MKNAFNNKTAFENVIPPIFLLYSSHVPLIFLAKYINQLKTEHFGESTELYNH